MWWTWESHSSNFPSCFQKRGLLYQVKQLLQRSSPTSTFSQFLLSLFIWVESFALTSFWTHFWPIWWKSSCDSFHLVVWSWSQRVWVSQLIIMVRDLFPKDDCVNWLKLHLHFHLPFSLFGMVLLLKTNNQPCQPSCLIFESSFWFLNSRPIVWNNSHLSLFSETTFSNDG